MHYFIDIYKMKQKLYRDIMYINNLKDSLKNGIQNNNDTTLYLVDSVPTNKQLESLGIKKDDFGFDFTIQDLNKLITHYLSLPKELTDVSLQNDKLTCINVDREKLKITSTIKRITGTTNIDALSGDYAVEWTNSYLQSLRCHNIVIRSVFFNETASIGGFNTKYEADKLYEKVNVKAYCNKEDK